MNLNKLRDKAYSIAKANGWHEEEHSDNHLLMLIITEIAEAVQADRKNLHADVEAFKKYEEIIDFKENFERQIKNTVEEELADVVIRCLDLAGLRKFYIEEAVAIASLYVSLKEGAGIVELCYYLSGVSTCDYPTGHKVVEIIASVLKYCELTGIDIDFFIRTKMNYNRLRGYKQGGKRY